MNNELKFLIEIVTDAASIITDNFTVKQKGDSYDLVTNLDIEVELYLIKRIKQNYPLFDIVSEEFNSKKELTNNCFVIDPIDGTINFANNLPLWGIQVACVKNGRVIASVINMVKQNELFYADEEKAYLNGNEINVKKYKELKNSIYSVNGVNSLSACKKMRKYSTGARNFGVVCTSMAYVACGRLHGASFTADTPWDYLPGLHIIEKAGGITLDKKGCHAGACSKEFLDLLEQETSY